MRNYVQPGKTITLTAPAGGVIAGTGYIIGGLFVVAQDTVDAGAEFEGLTEGVVDLAKTAAVAFTEGAKVSFDSATHAALAPAVGKFPIGAAVQAAAGGDATVRVRLDGISTAAA